MSWAVSHPAEASDNANAKANSRAGSAFMVFPKATPPGRDVGFESDLLVFDFHDVGPESADNG